MAETFKTPEPGASSGIPSKKERTQEVFDKLAALPAFSSIDESYAALKMAFQEVEGKYFGRLTSRYQEEGENESHGMGVEDIDYRFTADNGRVVAVIIPLKEYVFLGENGSMEIQKQKDGDEIIYANPGNDIIFEKKGADAKGVWE